MKRICATNVDKWTTKGDESATKMDKWMTHGDKWTTKGDKSATKMDKWEHVRDQMASATAVLLKLKPLKKALPAK
ncbi:hypothetical protein niasHT_032448 [Heterodera trifolii]|uniref:Uncharacterized protein n=1 Tax=Heterodera trifolii TaxID=157864 RepID=A0ABD2IKM9_9BILA